MKLQISFDMTDLEQALEIAQKVSEHSHVLEIGTILIYTHGLTAIERFRETFPNKTLLADTKIIDRGKDIVPLLAKAGADWITIMAGTGQNVIHSTSTAAHNHDLKVMIDLLDAASPGQSALEAKNLGADALLFHEPYDEKESLMFLDKWDMIKGNTALPVYVSAKLNRDNVNEVIAINPDGIVVGKSITDGEDPAKEAQFYYDLCNR